MTLGPFGLSWIIPHLKTPNSITSAKSPLPSKAIPSQFSGITMWTSLGTVTLPTTLQPARNYPWWSSLAPDLRIVKEGSVVYPACS